MGLTRSVTSFDTILRGILNGLDHALTGHVGEASLVDSADRLPEDLRFQRLIA